MRCTVDSSYKICHHQNTEILSYSCYIVILPYSILQHHYILGLYNNFRYSGIDTIKRPRNGLPISIFFTSEKDSNTSSMGLPTAMALTTTCLGAMQLFFHDMILVRIIIYSLNCGMVSDLKTWIKSEMEIRRANSVLVQLDFWRRLLNLLTYFVRYSTTTLFVPATHWNACSPFL